LFAKIIENIVPFWQLRASDHQRTPGDPIREPTVT